MLVLTQERKSVLGLGIDSFKQHCHDLNKLFLVEYINSRPNDKLLVHRSCKRSMAYKARVCNKSAVSSQTKVVQHMTTRSSTGEFSLSELIFMW